MNVVITYDISDNKVRTKFHHLLKNLGYNIQKSVFECDMSEYDLIQIRKFCVQYLDVETDSVRIYKICSDCLDKAQVQGTTIKLKADRWVII
ncbi:CRISPR-associated endonuclease Cas2 [Desulfothermus okinawensis JCM 13304]